VRQVQVWFQAHGVPNLSVEQATAVADAVNANQPPECDRYYDGCVPANASTAHCIGEGSVGLEVIGPLRVNGWDHFGLDRDQDGVACEGTNPVGSLDLVSERPGGFGLRVQGWAFDHDTPGPIEIHTYDNGVGRSAVAAAHRADLAGARHGPLHGFDASWDTSPGVHEVCVYAINVGGGGNVLLGCRTVEVSWDAYMVQLVNQHRSEAGLAPLTWCRPLDVAAAAHSADQAAGQFMSHVGSDGSSVGDRIARTTYGASFLGENVAWTSGFTTAQVVTLWMNSSGHRANILNPAFAHIGVGRATSSRGSIYWTQDFGAGGSC
jgi:hypothetical protein